MPRERPFLNNIQLIYYSLRMFVGLDKGFSIE